jgi:DNA-binding NarL/FixJ family response regulator
LLKSTTARELRVAAEAVAHRETVFSDEIAAELIQVAITPTEADGSSAIDLTLTARENEVLRLVATGKDNAEIAGELFVSRYTVKNHVARILEKLGLENRVQAAVHASQLGAVADRV